MQHPIKALSITALLALVLATAAIANPARSERCHIEGVEDAASCHRIEVPEDPAAPVAGQIALRVVVLPALGVPRRDDPLYILAGGPGQAASTYGALVSRVFAAVRKRRDIVLVDHRGTGGSQALACGAGLRADGRFDALMEALLACRREWPQDLRHYTTFAAASDLEQVRIALGHARINLWGGSYGTRLAQEYQRRFPQATRAVVLDSVVPPSRPSPQDAGRFTDRAFALLAADCAADSACAAAHGDLDARLRSLLARLEAEPASVGVADPRSGRPQRVTIDAPTVRAIVRGALYSTAHSALLPSALRAADAGEFGPLLALSAQTRSWSLETMSLGLTANILCREDTPRLDEADLREQREQGLFGSEYADEWRAGCARWNAAADPPAELAQGRSDVPTLLLSGELDPVTPPASAERALALLSHGVHRVARKAGHVVSTRPCVGRLIAEFLEAGSAEGIDASCLEQGVRPAFWVAAAEAAP